MHNQLKIKSNYFTLLNRQFSVLLSSRKENVWYKNNRVAVHMQKIKRLIFSKRKDKSVKRRI